MKVVIEHVYNKYVFDKKIKQKLTRCYAYGCSLGAQIVGRYLIEEGDAAATILDGACLYAAPWDLERGSRFFYENCRGLYAKGMGLRLN